MLLGDRRRRVALFALAFAMLITACATSSTETGSGAPNAPTGTAGNGSSTTDTGGVTAGDVAMLTPPEQPDVQHLKFKYGPIKIEPGQNNITISNLQVPKPTVDGFIVGIHPNLYRDDGSIPPVDVIHLHHGVWLKVDLSSVGGGRRPRGPGQSSTTTTEAPTGPGAIPAIAAGGTGAGGSKFGQIFFASGEEKTQMVLPAGYGYPYKAKDVWVINYMLHNLLSTPDSVSIVYDLDFIPADSAGGKTIKAARPIWNDVESGKIYPVFDVLKGSGKDGVFTYPDDAPDAYKGREKANEVVLDKDLVLLGTAGHLHPGGLYTDMYVSRAGAGATASAEAKPSITGDKAHIFRSDAVYYEPAGAVSWDVSMTATSLDWRVAVKAGDVISISSTYDTKRASWYESMGIMVLWAADAADATGADPFQVKVDAKGVLTHGHLAENDNHGGNDDPAFVDMTKLPDGATDGTVTIADFAYAPGDMSGIYKDVPTIKAGQPLKFVNQDAPIGSGIWHTITACKAPCTGSTGVAYPLADADVGFDSGELGNVGPPTAGTIEWSTPTDLAKGTYTYFCRIHPSMRGAFRVEG
jgi:plastocyanin